MAPPASRPPSLPSIPDIALDLDEKTQLLPELDEMLSQTGESGTTAFDDDDGNDIRPSMSRSHSTHTQHSAVQQRRIHFPTRLPSISSSTYTPLPLTPRRPGDPASHAYSLQLPPTAKSVLESWTITYHHSPRTHNRNHPPSTPLTPTTPTAHDPNSTTAGPIYHLRLLGITLFRYPARARGWRARVCHARSGGHDREHAGEESGSVVSVVPNPHFSQEELAGTVAMHEAAVLAHAERRRKRRGFGLGAVCGGWGREKGENKCGRGGGDGEDDLGGFGGSSVGSVPQEGAVGMTTLAYAADVERRVRRLAWKVQDEIYELLSDRVQSSSSAFRRREWRVVALTEVPGGELTDAPTGFGAAAVDCACTGEKRRRRRRAPDMPITEYRLVLRGTETKVCDRGWGHYNRYSRPWKMADEKEMGERRRWSTLSGRSEKYVDF